MTSTFAHRTDDFRCHDNRLAAILPGREKESARAAIELQNAGVCDGIFVQGKDTTDWSFLEIVESLDRFHFASVHSSFAKIDFRVLRNATSIRVSSCKVKLDLTGFDRLIDLTYDWLTHPLSISSLPNLRTASFWGIGRSDSASLLHLPESLIDLTLVRYSHPQIAFGARLSRLSNLEISYARDLQALPSAPALRSVHLKNVGREQFDYTSIPQSTETLDIESCAPIVSWDFTHRLKSLRHLNVCETNHPKLGTQYAFLMAMFPG